METTLGKITGFNHSQQRKGEGSSMRLLVFIFKITDIGKHCWNPDEFDIKVDERIMAGWRCKALGQALAPSCPAGQGAAPAGC